MALSLLRYGARTASRSFQKGIHSAWVGSSGQASGRSFPIFSNGQPHSMDLIRQYSKSVTGKREQSARTQSDSDSDSDDECYSKERGESEFWRRKMRTFHKVLDINKDGVISYDDLKVLADRFVDLGHLSHENEKEFKRLIQSMWEERWGSMDPYNMITTEQLLEEMHHVMNDKNLRKKVHSFLPLLFKALDKDKSGMISVEEYKLFYKCLGLTDEVAIASFSLIDENDDGQLSLKEFVKLGRDFFVAEDHKRPSKLFWGPLVH